jgi:general stress protein CsbA
MAMQAWISTQLNISSPGFWLLIGLVLMALSPLLSRVTLGGSGMIPRLLIRVLPPYIGLIAGGLSPRFLGLTDLNWVAGLGVGITLIVLLSIILGVMRMTTLALEEAHPSSTPLLERILDAGSQEFQWSFLRGALWGMLLTYPGDLQDPRYWAVWLGALLALMGIFAQYPRTAQRLINAVILVQTSILFYYTRNFWLCWLLHTLAVLLIGPQLFSQQEADKAMGHRAMRQER